MFGAISAAQNPGRLVGCGVVSPVDPHNIAAQAAFAAPIISGFNAKNALFSRD